MTLVSSLASETRPHGQAQGWVARSPSVASSATVTGSDSSEVCAKAGAAFINKPAKTVIATPLIQFFESWLTEILLNRVPPDLYGLPARNPRSRQNSAARDRRSPMI